MGRFVDRVKRFDANYQKLSVTVDKLLTALERARMGLLKDVTVLDKMYELNLDHLHQLDLYIAAGQEMLDSRRHGYRPGGAGPDLQRPPGGAAARRPPPGLTRFERRVHDLKLTRMIAIQTAPQIRLIQGNDQNLVEKIQSSITTTVPLWKNQIVIALSLYRQQQARPSSSGHRHGQRAPGQERRTPADGSAEVARETERGIVDVESLQKVNDDLIATLEETIRIQEEGHARRVQAEGELLRLQNDLRQKMIELRSQAPQIASGPRRSQAADRLLSRAVPARLRRRDPAATASALTIPARPLESLHGPERRTSPVPSSPPPTR